MNAIAKTLIVAWLIFLALTLVMATASAAECAIEERSARGYCPGTTGHQEELDGFDDLAPIPVELPHTGIDTCLAAAGALSLIMVGGALVNLYGKDEE